MDIKKFEKLIKEKHARLIIENDIIKIVRNIYSEDTGEKLYETSQEYSKLKVEQEIVKLKKQIAELTEQKIWLESLLSKL